LVAIRQRRVPSLLSLALHSCSSRLLSADISWNETRTGTDQVRFYKLDGNILTITTAPNKSMVDGQEGRGVLVWEGEGAADPVSGGPEFFAALRCTGRDDRSAATSRGIIIRHNAGVAVGRKSTCFCPGRVPPKWFPWAGSAPLSRPFSLADLAAKQRVAH
jgi:hypothetical protein